MGMDQDEYLGRHLSRRCFLAGAGAAGLAIPVSGFGAPEQVHDLRGQVLVNGRQATTPGMRNATARLAEMNSLRPFGDA